MTDSVDPRTFRHPEALLDDVVRAIDPNRPRSDEGWYEEEAPPVQRRHRVLRAVKALVIAILLEHCLSLINPAVPSLALWLAHAFPQLHPAIPYLLDLTFTFGLTSTVFCLQILSSLAHWRATLIWRSRPPANPAVRGEQTLHRLFSYLKPNMGYLIAVIAAIVVAAAMDLTQPYIIGFLLINNVIGFSSTQKAVIQPNLGLLPFVVFLLVFTFICKEVASFLQNYLGEVLSQKTVHRLRSDVYHNIERLPIGILDKSRTGELVSRIVSDTNEVEKVLSEDFGNLLENAVTVVGTIGVLFYVDFNVALFVLPVAFAIILSVNAFKKRTKRISHMVRQAVAELSAKAVEVISGIRIVKSFVREAHETRAFQLRSIAISKAKLRLARLSGLYASTVDFLTLAALVAVVWFGAPAVVTGAMTIGALTSFVLYLQKMFSPLIQLSKINLTLQKVVAAADRIFEIVDAKTEVLERPSAVAPPKIEGRIEFDKVTFAYRPGRNVLDNFSLVIEPGETVAVVGSSGVGKSTMVELLLRFYQPDSGQILLDGYPIEDLNLAFLRNKVGLVLQEPVLFSGTILENIQYGKPDATEEEIIHAAQAANAHNFIASLPKGYLTTIGERGVSLSVGQRQRISIARAILKNPPVLVMDEATSNIDSESESLIQDALRRMARRKTMIIIGHRLSSIMDADRIVVLSGGGIAEVGTHEDLVEKGGAYARLYEAQLDHAGPAKEAPRTEDALEQG